MSVATASTSGPQSGETASSAADWRSRKAARAVSTRDRSRSASSGLTGIPWAAVGRACGDDVDAVGLGTGVLPDGCGGAVGDEVGPNAVRPSLYRFLRRRTPGRMQQ